MNAVLVMGACNPVILQAHVDLAISDDGANMAMSDVVERKIKKIGWVMRQYFAEQKKS